MEFRLGVREALGLNATSKDIDEIFERFDKDGGGTIDAPELGVGLKWLEEKAEAEKAQRGELSDRLGVVTTHIAAFEKAMEEAMSTCQLAIDAAAKLADYTALPHVDARLGEKLNAK